jgi:hypothetical protein
MEKLSVGDASANLAETPEASLSTQKRENIVMSRAFSLSLCLASFLTNAAAEETKPGRDVGR